VAHQKERPTTKLATRREPRQTTGVAQAPGQGGLPTKDRLQWTRERRRPTQTRHRALRTLYGPARVAQLASSSLSTPDTTRPSSPVFTRTAERFLVPVSWAMMPATSSDMTPLPPDGTSPPAAGRPRIADDRTKSITAPAGSHVRDRSTILACATPRTPVLQPTVTHSLASPAREHRSAGGKPSSPAPRAAGAPGRRLPGSRLRRTLF